MRKNLFRAKITGNGKWTEGYYYADGNGNYILPDIPEKEESGKTVRRKAYRIDPETLCEYTGYDTLDGEKIWENDIVLAKTSGGVSAGQVMYGSVDGLNLGWYIQWPKNSLFRNEFLYWAPKITARRNPFDGEENT